MPSPWIKIEWTLPDKLEVCDIAQYCGLTTDDALGKLVRVFVWYDQNFEGDDTVTLKALHLATLARITGCEKFPAALLECGWLIAVDDNFEIANFSRHNSKSAKNRALAQGRMDRMRDRERYANTVTREEKRREELKPTPPTPSKPPTKVAKEPLELPDWLPVEAWINFLAMRHQKGAKLTEAAQRLAISRLEKFRAMGHDPKAVLDQSTLGSWTGLYALKEERPPAAAAATGFAQRDYQKGATPHGEIDWVRDSKRDGPADD